MSFSASRTARARAMVNKVAEVTVFFWIIKILATTVGETFADLLGTHLDLSLTATTVIMSALLAVVLAFQFRAREYIPGVYWLAVVMISVVGTLITDNLVDNLGVTLRTATIVFSIALLVTFTVWYRQEKTLSIHSVDSTKREAYYWVAILFTFALGTAAGDLLAEGLDIGYWKSALLFAGAIGLVSIAFRFANLPGVWAFWVAYILTRPLGASIGDYLSQPRDAGGLNLGTTVTSVIFLTAILGVVVYLSVKQRRRDALDAELFTLEPELESVA